MVILNVLLLIILSSVILYLGGYMIYNWILGYREQRREQQRLDLLMTNSILKAKQRVADQQRLTFTLSVEQKDLLGIWHTNSMFPERAEMIIRILDEDTYSYNDKLILSECRKKYIQEHT